jgi:internalin A
MRKFGTADHVVAVISDKYLRSPYCMAELHSVWQNCNSDPERFRRRVHPLILDDAQIGTVLSRLPDHER